MEHLTYEEYVRLGGSVDDERFSMLEARANRLVDTLTHGRLASETPLRTNVKYCMMQLIDAAAADAAIGDGTGREVSAMSNDGVSVTFASSGTTAFGGSAASRNARIVREWLDGETTESGVMLLYAGVDA